MAEFNRDQISKLKKGERIGTVATCFCGAVLIYFIVCFPIAYFKEIALLETIVWATAAPLMAVGIAISAFCNLKFGRDIDKAIKKYVVEVFVENAAAMHPERDSLSFFLAINGNCVEVTVNGYKEKIVFDFSVFGRFSAARKIAALNAITERLCATFCRLYERGSDFKSVNYLEKSNRRKAGKTVPIIADGKPDVRAMKTYLKSK